MTTPLAGIPYRQARSGIALANSTRSDYAYQRLYVVVAGVDRTLHIDRGTLQIISVLTQQPTTAAMEVTGFAPTPGQSLVIASGSLDNVIFSGTVQQVTQHSVRGNATDRWNVQAVDGTWLLNRRRVTKKYLGAQTLSFPSATTWSVPAGVSQVDVLVVGAGGGGGSATTGGGGGGGGAVVVQSGVPVSGSVAVGVGAGGSAGSAGNGGNGGDSSFGSVTAKGGGGGGGQGSGSTNVVTFNVGSTWVCPASVTSVDYLIVGGGGPGGGINGGGGGGGGVLSGTDTVTPGHSYPIAVGGGGSGANGANSSFNGHVAIGGGAGGNSGVSGANGGCGGGGGDGVSGSSSGGTGSQGGNGGSSGSFEAAGGGGGGAGGNGGAASFAAGGAGGSGTASSITGSSVTYAGGGGGNGNSSSAGGGSGGGGNGGAGGNPGTQGTDGLGGGGGAGGAYDGGDGVVILRYTLAAANQAGQAGGAGGGGSTGLPGGGATGGFIGGSGGASAAGGGGGAGAAGSAASGSTGGSGGVGVASSVAGVTVNYGAGGGGYASGAAGDVSAGAGGNASTPGAAGQPNTGAGGGGGGNGQNGGAGGSGLVIVAWGVSASDVIRDLLENFASGFSANHVQDGAPQLPGDVTFRGELLSTALQTIANSVNWNLYLDPKDDVHFYADTELIPDPQPLTPTNSRYDELEYTLDLSQVRTRVFMVGGGAQTTAPVAAAATTIPVDECGRYASGGGRFVAGTNIGSYTGVSAGSGPGNLTGVSGLTTALLQGDTVSVLAEVDDMTAQSALAALEGGDGIHEYWQEDSTWTLSAATASGRATLEAFRESEIKGRYVTYDKTTTVGRHIRIVIPNRNINTTVTVQRVTRSLAASMQWQFAVDFAVTWNDFFDLVNQAISVN